MRSSTTPNARSRTFACLTITTRRPTRFGARDCRRHSPTVSRQAFDGRVMATRMHPGETVDGFTIEGLLHTGGNGYIYRVRPEPGRSPGFPLLMKVPGVGHGEPTLGVVSFEIEQVILPQLTGPHVPRVVAVGDDPMRPYLVMEEIVGEGLAAIVGRAPLPVEDVVRTGAALADAVHDIHRQ